MSWKKTLGQLLTVCLLITSTACSSANEASTVIEDDGVRLTIPKNYVFESRDGWWSTPLEGLDSNQNSALVKISYEEILGGIQQRPDHLQGDLLVLVILQNEKSGARLRDYKHHLESMFSDDAYSEYDQPTGLHRIYYSRTSDDHWLLARRSLEAIRASNEVTSHDIAGTCSRDQLIGTSCDVNVHVDDRLLVGFTISEKALVNYQEIGRGLVDLIAEWRSYY